MEWVCVGELRLQRNLRKVAKMANDNFIIDITLESLLDKNFVVPSYQRPYAWQIKEVTALLEDLIDACNADRFKQYMMGTIIVFKKDEQLEIVDGQQRLTTFAILCQRLDANNNCKFLGNEFNHLESILNINKNARHIDKMLEDEYTSEQKKNFYKFIKENVCFAVVTAPTLDDAFTFFDSQNARGKALLATDILKAHHLRHTDPTRVTEARRCAGVWEEIDKIKEGNLLNLIETLIGRCRKWSRSEVDSLDIKEEFKAQKYSVRNEGFYQLSRYHQPPIFELWRYIDREEHDDDDGLELIFRDIDAWQGTKRLKFVSKSKMFMPFQLNQPLEGGEQFFWFIEKYNSLYNELFVMQSDMSGIFKDTYNLFRGLSWNSGVSYLKSIFEAAALFYYDKFGPNRFDDAVLCIEHGLTMRRLISHSVHKSTVKNFVQNDFKIFSIINKAAHPQYVMDECRKSTIRNSFRNEYSGSEDNGIRKLYLERAEEIYAEHYRYTKNDTNIRDFLLRKDIC